MQQLTWLARSRVRQFSRTPLSCEELAELHSTQRGALRENLLDPPGYPPTHTYTHRKNMPACTSVFEQPKHTFLALPKHLQKGMCYFGRSLTQTHTYTDT